MQNDEYINDYNTKDLVPLKIWGFTFLVTPRFVKLYADKLYEPVSSRVFLYLALHVQPTEIIIDGGAHYGYYSLLAASRVKNPISSFEPIMANAHILGKNRKRNHFNTIHIYNAALSHHSGSRAIALSNASDSSSFAPHPTGKKVATVPVTTQAIDDLKARIGFIKLDIEGHELPALKGAENTLKKSWPFILFEYHPESQRLAGNKNGELFTFLTALGYTLWAVNEDSGVTELNQNYHHKALEIFKPEQYGNIIAIHPKRMIRLPKTYTFPGKKLDDSGIGVLEKEYATLLQVKNIEMWWLKKELSWYKKELARATWEIGEFKKKKIYKYSQMVKRMIKK